MYVYVYLCIFLYICVYLCIYETYNNKWSYGFVIRLKISLQTPHNLFIYVCYIYMYTYQKVTLKYF